MTGRDVPDADMPNMPRPHRADMPAGPDEALDALLAGELRPDAGGDGLRPVADLLAALTAPAGADELAGHAQALAEFRQTRLAAASQQDAAPRRLAGAVAAPVPRRARRPRSGPATRAAAATATLAAVLGGLASAAYAGVLPAPVQQVAHEIIGAPPPHPVRPVPGQVTRSRRPGTAPGRGASPDGVPRPSPAGQPAATPASAGPSPLPGKPSHWPGQPSTAPGRPSHSPGRPSSPPGRPSSPPGKPSSPPGKPSAEPTPHHSGQPSSSPEATGG
jgi:hypothetical protein